MLLITGLNLSLQLKEVEEVDLSDGRPVA